MRFSGWVVAGSLAVVLLGAWVYRTFADGLDGGTRWVAFALMIVVVTGLRMLLYWATARTRREKDRHH